MSQNVGQIDLDLVLQSREFQNQLNNAVNSATRNINKQAAGLTSGFKKLGGAIGAAFAVSKIASFGKECTKLGSDLAEVQNVVDVSFGSMADSINQFATDAMETYGLSETIAKRYAGAFGAMSSSMGFTQEEAVEMSKTLTGLAGDVASFYNMDSAEAYTKLKSVFTGETETLKDLGVVMTQANLDNYALANGFGKTTKSMNETEKTALRYQFVLDKLGNAQGDFARTSDSWANQTRVLSLRFDALKASLGQGFINVLTPVIKMLNVLLSKLQAVADGFSTFTEKIMGKKAETSSGTGAIAEDLALAADSAEETTDNITSAGNAAKKARSLMGIDELNTLTDNSSSDTSAGGTGGIDTSGLENIETVAETTEKKLNPTLQKMVDYMKELSDIFKNGFKAGLGDVTLEPLKEAVKSIGQSFKEIFTDSAVVNAADNFVKKTAYALGQMAGATASVGITIATNLVGGLAKYLEQNKDRVKKYLVAMFDIGADIVSMAGDFAQAFANVFSAFGQENGQQLTANIIGIFADATMGVYELMAKAGRDIMNVFTKHIIDNYEALKSALSGILDVFVIVTGSIKDTIDMIVDTANATYDAHIKPLFDSLANGLSNTAAKFLEVWAQYVQPILENIATKFSEVMSEHIQPLIKTAIELIGSVADAVKAIWEGVLKPLIDWLIANVLPVIMPVIQTVVNTLLEMVGQIANIINGIIKILKGIIDFIVGVFTGDWEKAWGGIESIVSGIFKSIMGIIGTILNLIFGIISAQLQAIAGIFSIIFNSILSIVKTIFSLISNVIQTEIGGISAFINLGLSGIANIWSKIWGGIRNTTIDIFGGIGGIIKGTINGILTAVEVMANGVINAFNSMIKAMNKLSFDIPDWIPAIGGNKFGFNLATLGNISIPKLAQGGYVAANTPQLAMIGDNRKEGEIVAPESKIAEAVASGMSSVIGQLTALLNGNNADGQPINIYLGNELLDSMIVSSNNRRTLRSGGRA